MNREPSFCSIISTTRILRRALVSVLLSLGFLLPAPNAWADGFPQVVFILDGSGSMWGDAGGQRKIEAAKEVMAKVVTGLPSEVKVGLEAYGHRQKGDSAKVKWEPTGEMVLAKASKVGPS